ncbi:PEGA domain-containing protein [candidate division KSB1 bacterium]
MSRVYISILLVAVFTLFQNCGTIMNGTKQRISITSLPSGADVNVDGIQVGKTPMYYEMKRNKNHFVAVGLPGHAPYETMLKKTGSGWLFGNIVFSYGGILGLGIDLMSGGVYKFEKNNIIATLDSDETSVKVEQKIPASLICPVCFSYNRFENNRCAACGSSLVDEKIKLISTADISDVVKLRDEQQTAAETKTAAGKIAAVDTVKTKTVIPVAVTEVKKTEPEEKPQEIKLPRKPLYTEPMDPKRLFVIPVADVLGSMEINTGGGSIFGVGKTDKKPYLGHLRLGLGDIAEIEVSSVGVINQLSQGTPSIPTAAFKLKILNEGKYRPAFAGAFRNSLWHSERIIDCNDRPWKFEKRIASLYFVASKTFSRIKLHSGISINDLRIRTFDGGTGLPYSPTEQEIENSDKDYFNKNIVNPFLGIQIHTVPRTILMVEFQKIANYNFDVEDPILSKDNITSEWMLISGLRYYLFNWMSLDTGVMYRGDFHGIGDAMIDAGMDINLPLTRMFTNK